VLAQGVSAQANNPRRSPWDLAFDVVMEAPAAPAAGASAGGAYYSSGAIWEAGSDPSSSSAKRVGTVRSWGWNFNPERPLGGAVTHMSFDFTGRGEIVTGGLMDNRIAVVAGTGEFRGANGQADVVALGPNAWRIIFDYSTPYSGT
jgi:hypothetical protein